MISRIELLNRTLPSQWVSQKPNEKLLLSILPRFFFWEAWQGDINISLIAIYKIGVASGGHSGPALCY